MLLADARPPWAGNERRGATRAMAVAEVFARARPAALAGQSGPGQLRHGARLRQIYAGRLALLALVCWRMALAAPTLQAAYGSQWPDFAGNLCTALVTGTPMMDSAWWALHE